MESTCNDIKNVWKISDMDTIYIRVDMNPVIATGHVMRCLSIADEISRLGKKTVFIAADEYPAEVIRNRGYEMLVLNSDWRKMEEELPQLLKYIKAYQIKKLLIDTYQVTERYLQALKGVVQIIYLDDLDAFQYPVDGLICYANYYDAFSYGNRQGKEGYYLGMDYVPLRKAFQNAEAKLIRDRIQKVLLLSGGTDSCGIIERMVEVFKNTANTTLITVCGRFYEGYEELKKKYEEYPNLVFYQNISNLEEYMKDVDLAISAGGTTLYELCALGTPTISYSFADNQLYNVKQFSKDGLIDYAGDVRCDDIFTNAVLLYEKYDKDVSLREERSVKMQQMVDGKGAQRIAQILLELNVT